MDNDILKVIMFVWIYGHRHDTDKLVKLSELDAVKFRIAIKELLIEPFCPYEKKTYYRLTAKGECLVQTMRQVVHLSLLSNL